MPRNHHPKAPCPARSEEDCAPRVLDATIPPARTTAHARDAIGHVVSTYGAEVFGFLMAMLDERRAAREVYTAVMERLPDEARRFAETCSVRALTYGLARRELARRRASSGERRPRASRWIASRPPAVSPYRSPAAESLVASIRQRLAAEDLELLILRVDRHMTWRELAITQVGCLSAGRLELESQRLRARFRRLKAQIARRAERHGA